MVNKSWLYGLIILLAQTCNPYYSKNNSRNLYNDDEPVFHDMDIAEEEEIEEVAPPPPPPPMIEVAPEEEEIFVVVEQMPRFPGCESETLSRQEKKNCSDRKMINFISKNIKYPEIARENGVEGRVIMKFMVGKDGSISKVKVLRDPGGGCGKEAERVVKMMPKWNPGMQRGKPVNVYFTLPVSFNLPKEKPKSKN